MRRAKTRLLLLGCWLSFSAHGVELEQWQGIWERYDAQGQLEERISAKPLVADRLLSSKIEYFKQGEVIASGASVMSHLQGDTHVTMHFTNGTRIQLTPVSQQQDSVVFHLQRFDLKTGQKNADLYTRFSFVQEGNAAVMRQDLYQDAEQQVKMLSVNFYKQSG